MMRRMLKTEVCKTRGTRCRSGVLKKRVVSTSRVGKSGGGKLLLGFWRRKTQSSRAAL